MTIVIFNCPILNFKFNRKNSTVSQYRGYLDFVHEVGETCGFQVEEDSLRIPSTKRVNVFFFFYEHHQVLYAHQLFTFHQKI